MNSVEKEPKTSSFTFFLNSQGIVEIEWNSEVLEITKEHLLEIRSKLKELGEGIKLPLYVDTREFIPISEAARAYTSTPESAKYTLANAIKIDTLAKKIIFNFLLRFMHPNVPTKAFTNKKEAFDWLLELKKEAELSE